VITTSETDESRGDAPLVEVRSHPLCLSHTPGLGHPERPERLVTVLAALKPQPNDRWRVAAESPLPPDDDTLGVLKWIHDADYIDRVREAAATGEGPLDSPDCVVSAGTFESAVAAAGLSLQAGLDLVNRRVQRVFVAGRPPAHHAERSRARGFCFFNSVALAAEVVVRSWNRPVLIVDFDALHGNGTQQHFWDRGDVAYLSVHRYPGFPGTGGANELGDGEGYGLTRNIPLARGADDELFCAAFERGLEEMGSVVQPAAIVVSAGFNGHHDDPVGETALTAAGYGRLTAAVMAAADRWSEGRVLSFLEGGFEPAALAESVRMHVEKMSVDQNSTSGGGMLVN
jgi:acetoin utilization deacetylase AcuC-like enzyme